MIARVIICVAAKDIEDEAREHFPQGLFRCGETAPDDFRQGFITGVPRRHVSEAQHRKRGNHEFARPAFATAFAVKAFNKQCCFVCRLNQFHGRDIESGPGRQPHGDKFGFDHIVKIRVGRKLGDVFCAMICNQRFRARAADGTAVKQGLIQLRR